MGTRMKNEELIFENGIDFFVLNIKLNFDFNQIDFE